MAIKNKLNITDQVELARLEERISKIKAKERSPVKDVEIKVLLKGALTDKTDDGSIYMKGVDASYYYEGYTLYKTESLEDKF